MTSTTRSPCHVRPATAADADRLVANNLAMALETEGLRLDPARLSVGVRAVLADPAKGRYFVAERDGRVVGQLMVTTEWSDWRNGRIDWIQSVYVAPEARRTGVYRALYEHLRALAEADPEVVGLRLYVHHDNTRAQQVYATLGMARAEYVVFEVDFVIAR